MCVRDMDLVSLQTIVLACQTTWDLLAMLQRVMEFCPTIQKFVLEEVYAVPRTIVPVMEQLAQNAKHLCALELMHLTALFAMEKVYA